MKPGMDMMPKYFMFMDNPSVHEFLFKEWSTTELTGFIFTCVAMCCLTILLEWMKCVQEYLSLRRSMNPLTYAKTEENISERSPLLTSLIIPTSVNDIRIRKIKFHAVQSLLHIIQLVIAYIVMLAAMKYDGYIFISICLGAGFGYFIFGTFRNDFHDTQSKQNKEPPERRSSLMEQPGTSSGRYGSGENTDLIS
ncbi:unnamed protein product [Owenia fusiformis]|uniref:Copper transport protein n=1 Tax=Owenia fusiformis TaxID=6347 RepID=A0A8S4NVM6_OWEFU|nr:unnamed protein product [Owenia fusiformis]